LLAPLRPKSEHAFTVADIPFSPDDPIVFRTKSFFQLLSPPLARHQECDDNHNGEYYDQEGNHSSMLIHAPHSPSVS
jgi:hypothetical protein